jgi:hypothetical protein
MAVRGKPASAVSGKNRKLESSRRAAIRRNPVTREKNRGKNSVAERSDDFMTVNSKPGIRTLIDVHGRESVMRPGSRDEVVSKLVSKCCFIY